MKITENDIIPSSLNDEISEKIFSPKIPLYIYQYSNDSILKFRLNIETLTESNTYDFSIIKNGVVIKNLIQFRSKFLEQNNFLLFKNGEYSYLIILGYKILTSIDLIYFMQFDCGLYVYDESTEVYISTRHHILKSFMNNPELCAIIEDGFTKSLSPGQKQWYIMLNSDELSVINNNLSKNEVTTQQKSDEKDIQIPLEKDSNKIETATIQYRKKQLHGEITPEDIAFQKRKQENPIPNIFDFFLPSDKLSCKSDSKVYKRVSTGETDPTVLCKDLPPSNVVDDFPQYFGVEPQPPKDKKAEYTSLAINTMLKLFEIYNN